MKYNEKQVNKELRGNSHEALFSGSIFENFIPNALSETNQIWIVSSISMVGAMLKILVLYVSWFTRKLTHGQTDAQTE